MYQDGYKDIRRALERFGFTQRRRGLYFGNQYVTPITCVTAVQALQKAHPWFIKVISDIRMLQIEEQNDLMPAMSERGF